MVQMYTFKRQGSITYDGSLPQRMQEEERKVKQAMTTIIEPHLCDDKCGRIPRRNTARADGTHTGLCQQSKGNEYSDVSETGG